MAVIVKTDNPTGLLSAIKKAIDDKSIETWSYDDDGDFTHTPEQWKKKAWLRPKVNPGELRFGLLGQENTVLLREIIGVYHGRFIEMLVVHFNNKFTSAAATAVKTEPDNYK